MCYHCDLKKSIDNYDQKSTYQQPTTNNTSWLSALILALFISLSSALFATDNPVAKGHKPRPLPFKGSYPTSSFAPLSKTIGRPFDNDPIRFTVRANKPYASVGEEIELTITAHYLDILSAQLFTMPGSNAFRLKLLVPEGFVQTGGDYSDYVGAELSTTQPTKLYTLRGFFSKGGGTAEFRLLRSHYTADANSLFVEKFRLPIRVEGATQVAVLNGNKGARIGDPLAFQIVSYDCNSGVLQYQMTGGDGSPINLSLPGQFAGTVSADIIYNTTFPSDGKVGRTMNGSASQSGNQISINFTNGCNLTSTNPNPPTNNPNPSTGGGLAFQIVSYDCNSGVLQYQFTGGDGSGINVSLPGIFGGTITANTVATYTFPGDGRTGRTVTGSATQSGNQISINFTNGCNLASTSPSTPDPTGGSGSGNNPNPTPPPTPNPPTGGCGTGSGLLGIYANSPDLSGNVVAVRTDAQINFTWGDSPIPGMVNADGFSVRWFGQVEAPTSGNYTFKTYNDDATRVWVNGQLLINDWNGHDPTWQQGAIYLTAGQKYNIVMDFADFGWGAQAQLYWEYPGQNLQIVPSCRLYPLPTVTVNGLVQILGPDVDPGYPIGPSGNPPTSGGSGGIPGIPGGTGGGSGVPGGPITGNPLAPKFTLPSATQAILNFYRDMSNVGISFTDDEKTVLADYNLFDSVRAYVYQNGDKPNLEQMQFMALGAFSSKLADWEKNYFSNNQWASKYLLDYAKQTNGTVNLNQPGPNGLPDLGAVGNFIRDAQLDSQFEREFFTRYWLGWGDLTLTKDRFDDIVRTYRTPNVGVKTGERIENTGVFNFKIESVSLYKSPVYDFALGGFEFVYRQGESEPFGLRDKYDFDPRGFGVGVTYIGSDRSWWAETATRGVAQNSPPTAKAFNITYP